MADAKSLLLVNDQEPQILIFHIRGEHPVGTDNNIYQSLFQILYRLSLLGCGAKPAHELNAHRKILHSLGEGIVVLLG